MIFILYPQYQKVLKAHRLSLSGSVSAKIRVRLSDSDELFYFSLAVSTAVSSMPVLFPMPLKRELPRRSKAGRLKKIEPKGVLRTSSS